jgi:gas vesicle protein
MSHQGQGGGAGVLLAFLAGAAVGAAVALLLAPAAGEETRRQGRELLNRQRENLATAFERARQEAQGRSEEQRRGGVAGDVEPLA